MKRYVNKIIAISLLIVVFVVSFNTRLDYDLDRQLRTIANSNKSADSCTTGSGTTYYVTASALNIRNAAGTNGSVVGSLSKCTQVKVYCKQNNFGKISKVSNKWVSMSYLSTSSTGCSTIKNTTTDPISFGSVDRKYSAYATGANDVNQMYRDKPGRIIMTLKGITNVASDDQNNINVSITNSSNTNVTSSFDITRTGVSNGQATFNIKMKSGIVYSEGQYTVRFRYGSSSANASKTFNLVGRYYNFYINVSKIDGQASAPVNKKNTWKVNLTNVEPTSAKTSDFTIKVYNAAGNDCSSNFNIHSNDSGMYFTVTNKTSYWSAPQPGDYKIVVKYNNTSYTTVRPNYQQTYNFSLGSREIKFEEQVDLRTSYRYTRYEETKAYTMRIIKKTNTNITLEELASDGVTYVSETISLNDFMYSYKNINLDNIEFINERPVIAFNAVKITRFYNDLYYYYDGVSNKTATIEELEALYPGITATINIVDTISGLRIYTFDENGYVQYNHKGEKTVKNKYLQSKSKQILSASGGQLNFKIKYSYLTENDKSVMPVITRSDGSVVGENDGFRIIRQEYESGSTEDTTDNTMLLTIDYDNTDESYTDTYKVTYRFENVKETYSFTFSILDGEIDYYLQSTSDGHLTDPFDAYNGTPPGNKRYEWYLGFYMSKSGALMDTKPSNSMSVKIYTEQADCTDKTNVSTCEASLYYFRQKDYIIELLNYKDGNVKFNLTYDNVVQPGSITMPISEFRTKFSEAAELFDNYQFDATTGNLLSTNNYRIKVLKRRLDVENAMSYITYIDESGKTVSDEIATDFNKKYPEFYYNNTLRYVFDDNGNIINGKLRGSLRELKDEDGNLIQGSEVTDQFNITIDPTPYNLERAITILPKVEVEAGTYYAYVGFEGAAGVGYLNNSEDPVITKDSFPEMWNRNIHMSTISYSTPQYDVAIADPEISNVGNDSNVLYANIDGTAKFAITPKYIYNFDGFTYRIEKKNGNSWSDVTSKFNVTANFNKNESKVTVKTIPSTTEGGDYRLVIDYRNDGFGLKDGVVTKEFSVNSKYYGLVFDTSYDITYAKNYSENKYFEATGYFISNPENIQLKVVRVVNQTTTDELVTDTANKRFLKDGKTVFNYEVSYSIDPENSDLLLYTVKLTNVQNAAIEGNYQLVATYKEGTNETSISTRDFKVSGNVYSYTISDEERARIDADNRYTIQRDVYVSHINKTNLDNIEYVIKKYDSSVSNYVDVSSADSSNRMFIISSGTPELYNREFNGELYEYKITLYIEVDTSVAPVNDDAQFLIEFKYDESSREFKFSSLNTLFEWNANLKISGIFHDESGDINVDKFYLNLSDVTLDIKLKTPHENNANFSITKCFGDTCQPSVSHEYNELFDATIERDHIVLKYKNRQGGIKLTKGEYSLIIYYSDRDKVIIPFQVETEFVRISFEDAVMYSEISSTKRVDNLFKNKKGHIEIPVSVIGTSYENTVVKITDTNGNGDYSREFNYSASSYKNNHLLDVIYNANTAEYGEYLITVEYTNADGNIISDSLIFTLNKAYFNFELSDPQYEPNPPIANADPYGKVIYTIDTENVFDGLTEPEKHRQKIVFANNAVITNSANVDVTEFFEIAPTAESPLVNFDIYLKYLKNQVEPGLYKLQMSYRLNDYTIIRNSYFEISDYEKSITIKNVDIISSTEDGRIHNNIGGIFKINFESIYDISVVDIGVVIKDSNSITVSDSFNITKYSDYINVELVPKEPAIASGKYTITITYKDPQTGKVTTNEDVDVTIYGKYKRIYIENMNASSTIIYADEENQYYTFDLDVSNISDEELSKMQTRIYDTNGNIVFSTINSDSVTNIFKVSRTDNHYRIDILAFKSRVGEYYVELLLENEDNDYNISNKLAFTIDKTKYRIRLSADSKVTPSNIYNDDENAFYDTDSALVNYKFTSDYSNANAKYSIKIYKKGILVREIEDINLGSLEEWGISYLTSEIEIDALEVGEYEIDICLNGLPYDGRTINVYKYVPVNIINLTINSEIITNISTSIGNNVEFVPYIDPVNATNRKASFSSSNENVFRVEGNTIIPVGEGTAKLIINHPDYQSEIDVSVANRLASDVYEIDYVNKTIFVNKMNVKEFTKDLLVSNLSNLTSDYKIDNSLVKNKNLVGTGSTITSGGVTYTIVVIGDVNCDGVISINDVTYVFRLYRKSIVVNVYQEKAAHIRKNQKIELNDATTLFRFYRGTINEI